MIRTVLSICIAIVASGLGACERHSADDLPEQYKNRHAPKTDASHEKAPAHGEKGKVPAGGHKG